VVEASDYGRGEGVKDSRYASPGPQSNLAGVCHSFVTSRSPLILPFGSANEAPLNLLSYEPRYGVQEVI
jgi:hypothetical protein